MKKLITPFLFCLMAFAGQTVFAQDYGPEWGENATPMQRRDNVHIYNLYQEAYRNKDFGKALEYLGALLRDVPAANQNIYVIGTNVLKGEYVAETSPERRERLADSVMMLYDMRLRYFGDDVRHGREYILRAKVRDQLYLKRDDRGGIRELFGEMIDLGYLTGENADLTETLFRELTEDYKNGLINEVQYSGYYDRLSSELLLSAGSGSQDVLRMVDEAYILTIGDCGKITQVASRRYSLADGDVAELGRLLSLLEAKKCYGELFFSMGEEYMAVEPASDVAWAIAMGYRSLDVRDAYRKNAHKAIDLESDAKKRADYCLLLASDLMEWGDYRASAQFARKAIDNYPAGGNAYVVLAQAYSYGSGECGGFEQKTVYWLAADLLDEAARLVEKNSLMADTIQQLSIAYRANFPTDDEIFYRGLQKGSRYEVSCGWITGITTVR